MGDIGRNAPCPCGSGRKYKRCCFGKQPTISFTPRDREAALVKLTEFAFRREFEEEQLVAGIEFWSGWLDAHADDGLGERAMDLDESRDAFAAWFPLDFRLGGGQTLLELMLRRGSVQLARGEREYLARMRDTHLRPYQVTDVTPGEGVRLIDLWTGQQVWVQERLGSEQLVRWDLLAVRLMAGADGHAVIDGAPYLYPVASKDVLLRNLRRAHRDFKRAAPFAGLVDFFKYAAPLFHWCWLEWVALRPLPTPVTAEGDPIVLARAVFDVRDREALTAALARHPDLEREDDGSYTWTEEAPEFRRGLGRFVVEGDRLVFETQSEKRVARGRELLESLAGDAVRFRAVDYEDPGRAIARVARRAGDIQGGGTALPAELEAEIVGQFYEQYYRRWLDEPIPALGGRTPREAAHLKRGRSKLVTLLQDFENLSARERLAGRAAYDFGWMWAELGLERPV